MRFVEDYLVYKCRKPGLVPTIEYFRKVVLNE